MTITKDGATQLAIGQHSRDTELLERCVEWTGKGQINGPYKRKDGCDLTFWKCTKKADVMELIQAIYPYLGERRRNRADELLDKIQGI